MILFFRRLAYRLFGRDSNDLIINIGEARLPEPTKISTLNIYGTLSTRNLPLIKKTQEEIIIKSSEVRERLAAARFTNNGTSSLLWKSASAAAKNLSEEQVALLPADIQKIIEVAKSFI